MRKLVQIKNRKSFKWDLIQIETSYYKDKRGREYHTNNQINIASGCHTTSSSRRSLPNVFSSPSSTSSSRRKRSGLHDEILSDSSQSSSYSDETYQGQEQEQLTFNSSNYSGTKNEIYVEVSSDEDFLERLRLGRKRQFKDISAISAPPPSTQLTDKFEPDFDCESSYHSSISSAPHTDIESSSQFEQSQGTDHFQLHESLNYPPWPPPYQTAYPQQLTAGQESRKYLRPEWHGSLPPGSLAPPGVPVELFRPDAFAVHEEGQRPSSSSYIPQQYISSVPPWWSYQMAENYKVAEYQQINQSTPGNGSSLESNPVQRASYIAELHSAPQLRSSTSSAPDEIYVSSGSTSGGTSGSMLVPDQALQGCLAEVSMFNMAEGSPSPAYQQHPSQSTLDEQAIIPRASEVHNEQALCPGSSSLPTDSEVVDCAATGKKVSDNESGSSSTACCSLCDLTVADGSAPSKVAVSSDAEIDENEPVTFNRLMRLPISGRGGGDLTNPWTWSTMYRSQPLAPQGVADSVVLPCDVRRMFVKIAEDELWCLFRRIPMSTSQVRSLLLFYCRSATFYFVMRWATSRCIKRTMLSRSRRDRRENFKHKYLHPCVECSAIVLVRTDEMSGLVYGRCLSCDRLHTTFRFDGSCVDEPSILYADDNYEPSEQDRNVLNLWTNGGPAGFSFLFSILAMVGPGLGAIIERRKMEFPCIDCGLGVIAALKIQAYAMCTWCKSTIRSAAIIDNSERGIEQHIRYATDTIKIIKAEYTRTPISLDDIA